MVPINLPFGHLKQVSLDGAPPCLARRTRLQKLSLARGRHVRRHSRNVPAHVATTAEDDSQIVLRDAPVGPLNLAPPLQCASLRTHPRSLHSRSFGVDTAPASTSGLSPRSPRRPHATLRAYF